MGEREQAIQTYTVDDMTVSTYLYDQNRRYPVEAGTRASQATGFLPGGYIPVDERVVAEEVRRKALAARVVDAAVTAWESRWGEIPWDLVQMTITHLTVQCLVEIRVDPR